MSKAIPAKSLSLIVLVSLTLLAPSVLAGLGVKESPGPAPEPVKTSAPTPAPPRDPNARQGAPVSPDVVARIGNYTITRDELEARLVQAIRPRGEEDVEDRGPVTAEAILRTMVAEKAMSMEGRKLGYLNDEMIRSGIEQFEQQQLIRMLVNNYLRENLSIDEAEVARLQKENPKWTHEQAMAMAQRAAATPLLERFYRQLVDKFQLKKVKENFAEAAQVHQRLLTRPAEPRGRGEYWIKNSQVRNELSEKEENLALATYEGGQFTLRDWLVALCNVAPPRRPADLGTPEGVEKLLDRALRAPILVAEAKARGYDKDEKLRSEVTRVEDQRLLYKVEQEKTKDLKEPTAEEIRAYFEKNKERFADSATLKIDQIWCADRRAAEKAREMLDGGAVFAAVKSALSLQKDMQPYNVSPRGEGVFWAELSNAEPNQVVGPVRGFYKDGARWRLVKVLDKTPMKIQPYSEQMANRVKWAMLGAQRRDALDRYQKELLDRYPYQIFEDRIKGLDPLEAAMKKGDNR